MKIYTKTGDKGQTGLISGKRLPKNDLRICAYGELDEVQSLLGVCLNLITEKYLQQQLKLVQNNIFSISAYLADDRLNAEFPDLDILEMERNIDTLTKQMPILRSFILPGGSLMSAQIHVARSVTRRAERSLVALNEKENINPELLIYINRLSDYLFTLARYVNFNQKIEETEWKNDVS